MVVRGGYNYEIDWWLTQSSSLMGERSNFGGLVAAIERGGTGGCSGTKGCGMIRVEPFETRGQLHASADGHGSIHGDFDRVRACEYTWRHIGNYSRWVLAARYCYDRNKLPIGLYGQLGDLSAVAYVVAMRLDDERPGRHYVERLTKLAGEHGSLASYEDRAAKALTVAHGDWALFRASAEAQQQ